METKQEPTYMHSLDEEHISVVSEYVSLSSSTGEIRIQNLGFQYQHSFCSLSKKQDLPTYWYSYSSLTNWTETRVSVTFNHLLIVTQFIFASLLC